MSRNATMNVNLVSLVSQMTASENGLTSEEIQNILNISEKSVPVYLSMARKKLGLEIKKDRKLGTYRAQNNFNVPSPAMPLKEVSASREMTISVPSMSELMERTRNLLRNVG